MYDLNQKHKQGAEKGLLLFNRVKNNITTLYLSNNDFSSATFKKSISNYFNSSKSFQSLVIYDNDGKMEYLYIKNPLILTEKPILAKDFVTKPEYKFNNFLFNLYSSSIIIPGSKGLNIEIVYKKIGFYEISNLIKIVIICLLVYIISTAFFLLFVPYDKKALKSEIRNITPPEAQTPVETPTEQPIEQPESQVKEQPEESQTKDKEQVAENIEIEPIKYAPLIKEINKSENEIKKEESLDSIAANIKMDADKASIPIPEESNIVADNTIKIDTDAASASIPIPEEIDNAIKIDTVAASVNIPISEEDDDNIIKIDQKTGLASSEDFSPKLGHELNKAAANDVDLSLLLLSFISEDKEKITVFFDNLPLLLRNFFMSQMSFRLSENKLAIIIPDKTVEESIKKTTEFITRLKNISTIENIFAGISSRNSRIISAERLIKETEGAISKATSDDHIIAFKSNPEKFREMIAKQESF